MYSRRRTREFLLQSLYARHELGEAFDRENFIDSYFDAHTMSLIDMGYIDNLEKVIISHQGNLISIIQTLAPRFDLATIPVMHIIIIMIALAEIMYIRSADIPESVSINEAIELAKRFSDDQGRIFINGVLSTFLKNRQIILLQSKETHFRIL